MREFLKDLNITACVGTWKEGEGVRYCLDNLLKWCDYIAIIQDDPDELTNRIITEYREKYPDVFRVEISKVPKLNKPENVGRRERVYRSELAEERLALVRKIHNEERPVDILLTPDSDEVFTDYLPEMLEIFWKSNWTSICAKPIEVYDTPYFIHNRGLMSHWRVYKYEPTIHFTPRRYQDHFWVYPARMAWRGMDGGFVHLSSIKEFYNAKRLICPKTVLDVHPNAKIWKLNKPAWELTPEEYISIIRKPCDFLLKDYEKNKDNN